MGWEWAAVKYYESLSIAHFSNRFIEQFQCYFYNVSFYSAEETSSMSQKPKDAVRGLTLQDPHSGAVVAENVTAEQPGSNSRGVDGSVGTVVQPVTDKDGAGGTVVQPVKDKDGTAGTTRSGSHSSSWLDDAADFVNEHLRAFRAIPWVLGGLGAILVIKYTHMVSSFLYHTSV